MSVKTRCVPAVIEFEDGTIAQAMITISPDFYERQTSPSRYPRQAADWNITSMSTLVVERAEVTMWLARD